MNRPLRWYDYLTVNAYWLGLTAIFQTLTPLVAPLLVQRYVGEALKGTYYGQMRLWVLMAALLLQALMGMLSDRSTHSWGRRRPFILVGTLGDIVVMGLIGFSAGLSGMNGYWTLFALYLLIQVTSNTAHGALQGLIPDVVPEEKRGIFSGIKAVFEVPLPVILVSFTAARMVSKGNIWGALISMSAVLLIGMLAAMLVPEVPLKEKPLPIDWKPFLRLGLMTAAFTLVILGMGGVVKLVSSRIVGLPEVGIVAIMGLMGLLGMLGAVVLGVWISIQLGLGAEVRKTPSFTWWVTNRLAFLVGTTNLASFTVYFLQGRLGFQHEKAAVPAATLTMFVGVFILLSALPSGWLADKFGKRKLLVIAGIGGALGTAIAVVTANLAVIYVGGCFIGASVGLFYAANWALGTEIVPKEQAGRFLGISNLAGAGAGAIGAYIGGPIADFITLHAPHMAGMGYIVLFSIYGMLFLLSTLALLGVRKNIPGHE